ncbi:MAG: DUF2271 domain-containing protein [Bacteroidales bacterium]|nr:DUF2271 domain-containing protein [Bacteroidales bacterium]MCF8404724.1 DUF2271 domain-containing protein [Bacteroidales bacterium]
MKTHFTNSLGYMSILVIFLIIITGFKTPDPLDSNKGTSSGELSFTVRTVSAGGNYSPKHVLVIWIEANNQFVKTRLLRGNQRKQYLYTWKASTTAAGSIYNVVDAITGSTLTSHTTHTVTWDCLDLDGNIVPDGEYTLWVEFTDKHAQGPLYNINFTKGPEAIYVAPPDETYFKDLELSFTPFVAEFSANETEICQWGTVTFTDESTNATSWFWDFGEGAAPATATAAGPHTVYYTTPGVKTVSLTINGNLTETKENYITSNINPTADFDFGGNELTVNFTNNSTNATSYLWDFGDGNTSIENNPSHTYAAPGSYSVSLTATYFNCTDEIILDVMLPLVGISETDLSKQIQIIPNPNNGLFRISTENVGMPDKITVYDQAGNKVTQLVRSNEFLNDYTIDLSGLNKGLYFLQFDYSGDFLVKKLLLK